MPSAGAQTQSAYVGMEIRGGEFPFPIVGSARALVPPLAQRSLRGEGLLVPPPRVSPSKVGRVHAVSHEYALALLRLKPPGPSSRLCLNLLLSSDVSHGQNLLMLLGLWAFLPRLQAANIPYRSSS